MRLVLVLAAALLAPILALAQNAAAKFPAGNITIVVPYAPGGPPDIIARLLSEPMGKALGTSVIVENKPGAGSALANAYVARSNPDGLTLLMIDDGTTVSPLMVKNPGYDLEKDFAWISPLMRSYMGLVVRTDFPAKSVDEFIAMAKAKPGDLKFGTSGLGSPPWLGGVAFTQATGIDLIHVPYRGVALALNDLIAGNISAVWVSQATAGPQRKAGSIKVLGVYGENRIPSIPEIPTFRESGIDTRVMDQGTWFGLAAPAATPREIVDKLNAAVIAALKDPDTRDKLEKADFQRIQGGAPAELRQIVVDHIAFWRDVFAKAGVKPED